MGGCTRFAQKVFTFRMIRLHLLLPGIWDVGCVRSALREQFKLVKVG